MDSKVQAQLEEAEGHFRALRLVNAYHIFRRYFDRLPFRPEEGHSKYIGMFSQVLLQLGKRSELKFYMRELERHFEATRSPHLAYALAFVYCHLPEPRLETARSLFEDILREARDSELVTKAKLMLAYYYSGRDDVANCRLLIDSIDEPGDRNLRTIWWTWQAKVLRDEKRFEEAERRYDWIVTRLDPKLDWYALMIVQLQLGHFALMKGNLAGARAKVELLRELFGDRQFKELDQRISELEAAILDKDTAGTIYLQVEREQSVLSYADRSLTLKRRSPADRLFSLLASRGNVDKEKIVRAIYDRDYAGQADDKLIYYHVHCLRKRLGELGISGNVLQVQGGAYRLLLRVESRKWEES